MDRRAVKCDVQAGRLIVFHFTTLGCPDSSTEATLLKSHIQFCSSGTLCTLRAVGVTLEPISNTVLQSLQNSTRPKHI